MIVDLVRNDLGRVCRPGSVCVEELAALERYPTVWQLTSTIAGELEPAVGLVEVFRALFPSGSVTGAPKRATMQLISRLEGRPRGVYCGAVGYLSPGRRRARFAVAIRTATVECARSSASYGAGGGITWDSDPAAEWNELLAKCSIVESPWAPPGLFETLGFDPAVGLVNLELHLDRLECSAARFAFPFDRAGARPVLEEACASLEEARRVRLSLDPSGAVLVETHPMPASSIGPVRLALAAQAVNSADVRLFHKSTDRSRYEQIRASRPNCDDVVMYNELGQATETTIANLAVQLAGQWWTPPVGAGLLPGVERGRLVADGVLRERTISLEDLSSAQDLAVVNSLRGWRPASLVP